MLGNQLGFANAMKNQLYNCYFYFYFIEKIDPCYLFYFNQAWEGSGIRAILRYPDPNTYPADP